MLGLSLSLTRAGVPTWSPRRLFAAGEQGAWYDPSDLSTLFQDSAGTTPVTAVGQPVGLMLDKRLGLVRGAELASLPLQATWTTYTAASTISNNTITTTDVGGGTLAGLPAGKIVELSIAGTSTLSSAQISLVERGTPNVFRQGFGRAIFVVPASGEIILRMAVAGTLTVTAISIRELPGNHASQSTTTARPLYQATPRRVAYDGVDDKLTVTFAASLGAACTVARAIPGTGAQILTAQTVGTTFNDTVTNAGLVIINRALTTDETTRLTAWLNARANA